VLNGNKTIEVCEGCGAIWKVCAPTEAAYFPGAAQRNEAVKYRLSLLNRNFIQMQMYEINLITLQALQ
jgi:hypothetical protein